MPNRFKWYQIGPVIDALTPFLALLAALLVGAVLLLVMGINPFAAYAALFNGAFGSFTNLGETIAKATPLLLVGLGICIAFRGGVVNVGGEGQMLAGALATTSLALAIPDAPGWLMIPLLLVAGFLGGMLWGAVPGVLKARFNVNEILSCIMLNEIAAKGIMYLLNGPMMDPAGVAAASRIPQTARISSAYDLPVLLPDTALHAGAVLAVVLAFVVYIFLWRTTLGYRIRAVGQNPNASRYAGIHVNRTMVLSIALSGGFAGLGGAIQVLGVVFRLNVGGAAAGFTGSAGFNGIVAALFGQLHPVGTIAGAFFFGALLIGALKLQVVTQAQTALATTLNGLVVIFVVSSAVWRRHLARRRELALVAQQTAHLESASTSPSEVVDRRSHWTHFLLAAGILRDPYLFAALGETSAAQRRPESKRRRYHAGGRGEPTVALTTTVRGWG
jgi:simple sugar transport system permease protein